MGDSRVIVRLTPPLEGKLEAMAARYGVTRAEVVRRLLAAARFDEVDAPHSGVRPGPRRRAAR